jgi:uncharacterized repeat protein (TIGR01451 family)
VPIRAPGSSGATDGENRFAPDGGRRALVAPRQHRIAPRRSIARVRVDSPRPGSLFRSGAVYVYEREGGVWTESARLLLPDRVGGESFGESVSVSGDTIAVGARAARREIGEESVGAVAIFVRGASGAWEYQAMLWPPQGATPPQSLGHAVAIDGDMVVSGSPTTALGGDRAGTVYTFVRSGTTWSPAQTLRLPDAQTNDRFGFYLDLDGDTLAAYGRGMEFVFRRVSGAWVEEARLSVPEGPMEDVAIEGDTLIAGSPADSQFWVRSGAAYVFRRTGSSWTRVARIVAPDPGPTDNLGYTVGSNGHEIIVGTATDANAAYLYSLVDETVGAAADLMVKKDQCVFDCGRSAFLTYVITVGNLGPDWAGEVVVRDQLPPGALFFDARATRGILEKPKQWHQGRVVWRLGDLAPEPDAVAELIVRAFVVRDGTYVNRVRITAATTDSDESNNAANTSYTFKRRFHPKPQP